MNHSVRMHTVVTANKQVTSYSRAATAAADASMHAGKAHVQQASVWSAKAKRKRASMCSKQAHGQPDKS